MPIHETWVRKRQQTTTIAINAYTNNQSACCIPTSHHIDYTNVKYTRKHGIISFSSSLNQMREQNKKKREKKANTPIKGTGLPDCEIQYCVAVLYYMTNVVSIKSDRHEIHEPNIKRKAFDESKYSILYLNFQVEPNQTDNRPSTIFCQIQNRNNSFVVAGTEISLKAKSCYALN